jgi:hypothetical protein
MTERVLRILVLSFQKRAVPCPLRSDAVNAAYYKKVWCEDERHRKRDGK